MPFLEFLEKAGARKKAMHFAAKYGFLCPFWASWGRLQHAKRACILEQKCGFLCLLGFLGKSAAKMGVHFKAKVWISMLFLGLPGGFAEWKKGMHFGAQAWISIPFLGLSEGFAARKKGMHFGARV